MKTFTMNQEIANQIIQQLGGQIKLHLMTGAKDFGFSNESVSFKIGRNASKSNLVQIKYNSGSDLYTVLFQNFSMKTLQIKTLSEVSELDVEQMRRHFENFTGLKLTLGAA